jgi:hypothetical protein
LTPQPPARAVFDEAAFTRAVGPVLARLLGGDGRVAITGSVSGNINRVLMLDYAGRKLGARVTLNAHRFRYERGIIKEVFAVLLLAYGSGRVGDDRLRRIVDNLLAQPRGNHAGHHWVRPIIHYDWSEAELPYPFFIFEWVEGEPLWRCASEAAYRRAGAELARLHRLRFQHFYQDIFAIDREARAWGERFCASFAKELAEAAPRLPPELAAKLAAFDVAGIAPGLPCLVHNDYTGANILVEPAGSLRVIDWDNWVVECPELDLVKMKYWTAIGADGMLAHHPQLFAAFRAGYDQAAEHKPDAGRLAAYERLWLLRTFNFESTRDGVDATSWQAVYPAAAAYLDHLSAC